MKLTIEMSGQLSKSLYTMQWRCQVSFQSHCTPCSVEERTAFVEESKEFGDERAEFGDESKD
jgi:hypothetical protein